MAPGADRRAPRGGRAHGRRPVASPARAAVLDALSAVFEDGAPLEDALAAALPAGTPSQDRRFARMLAASCLRRLGEIDAALGPLLEKPLPRKAARVRDILRLGAADLLFLDTPAHAAVDQAVRLARADRTSAGFAGLVNAVLRRLDRERPAPADPLLNLPGWIRERWTASWGEKATRAMAAALASVPPLDITVRDPAGTKGLADALGAEVLATGSLRLATGTRIDTLPGFAQGHWWVQGAAAALPARLLAGAVAPGTRVADLCAAPGGKTLQLAAAGLEVTAVDISDDRLERLRENLSRTGLAADVIAADVRAWTPDVRFDGILLDAPCLATGTAGRHPDVLWSKRARQLDSLVSLQAELTEAAIGMLTPGGVLVFATCSLEPEEGEARAARLAEDPRLISVPIRGEEVGGVQALLTPEGWLRTRPDHDLEGAGGLEGFFAARFRRTG
ncbi:transcription antitermination factor NusB [Futiania mangrovi]|uniref:Methyltransferase domain-containing protein n=1 Tax=Futiania mangrovi TaxID=2959716 RepID=A0A9J6PBI7_9PROT|nr:transcription antitermination factor NusB [Futiania mangrovii]MCP1336581.1 methyltransferase domain-containing protein [Futiania mangrovii]